MWLLKKFGKNVIFSQNHTEINSDDWTITKKTTRTIKHENFSKMKILKVDRWALSSRWRPVAYLARPLPLPNVVLWSLATRVKKCASLNKNLYFYSNCTPIRGNKQSGSHCLTHWGRVTHICVSNLTIIGSDNGLSPGWHQAIIWSNAGILLIRTLGTKFSEILSKIHTF